MAVEEGFVFSDKILEKKDSHRILCHDYSVKSAKSIVNKKAVNYQDEKK